MESKLVQSEVRSMRGDGVAKHNGSCVVREDKPCDGMHVHEGRVRMERLGLGHQRTEDAVVAGGMVPGWLVTELR